MTREFTKTHWPAFLIAAFASGPALQASAADVRASLSARETYVGLPISLNVRVTNASKVDPPIVPEIDGLTIKSVGRPARSTQITSVNGRTTTNSTLIYRYELTPQRSASFRIPPITVRADGHDQQTQPINFVASKSETGDLVFVEVTGKQSEIYVGQALDLTLKIWLRPFRDSERGITLSESDMWKMISDRTNWGPFADRVQQLLDTDKRPAGREVLRKDQGGVDHSYYLYQIEATIYPKGSGKISANDVKLVVNYPTALGKSRGPLADVFDDMPFPGGRTGLFGDDDFFASPFGSRLTVKSVRPIVMDSTVEPINVLPIPAAGRPADYRGAVGKYLIATEASPRSVTAGDPINLLIGISGTGPMELVQAPPLAELPALTADFKVPDEPLAGFVKGDRKLFSMSIRPRKEGVTQIPAIPFSYFDPAAKKFVTVYSDPISIRVAPADTLALEAVIQRDTQSATDQHATNSPKSDSEPPSLAIFTGDDVLRTETPAVLNPRQLLLLLAIPPIFFFGILALRARRSMLPIGAWFQSSIRRFKHKIDSAEHATDVAQTFLSFVAKRLRMNVPSTDAATVIGALRSSGHRDLAIRCERILNVCEHDESGHGHIRTLAEVKHEALKVIDDLQREGRRVRPMPAPPPRTRKKRATASSLRSSTATIVVAVAVAGLSLASGQRAFAAEGASASMLQETPESAFTLTKESQSVLLAEANEHYNKVQSLASKDSADAKQAFAESAEKFELLVHSGVRNPRLFINLGNAYLQSGQTGRAIANYRRSLRIDPTNRIAKTNLAYAEGLVATSKPATPSDPTDARLRSGSISTRVTNANGWLVHHLGPRSMLAVMFIAWFTLWAAIGLRVFRIRSPWKTMTSAAIVLLAVAATSYALTCQETAQRAAVVIANDVTLHVGDGPNFPAVEQSQLREGQTVELCKVRGDWLQVRTETGQIGWLPRKLAEII